MTRGEILLIVKNYADTVERALILEGKTRQTERAKIRKMGEKLYDAILDWAPKPQRAREVKAQKTAERRAAELFSITWYDPPSAEVVVGWDAIADRVTITAASLRVLLSVGKGTVHRAAITQTGDIAPATIRRVNWQPGRGRPARDDLA